MKRNPLLLLIAVVISVSAIAQPPKLKYLRERAENNLKYLSLHYQVKNRVLITDAGITMLDKKDTKEFIVFWEEVSHLVKYIEGTDYKTLVDIYEHKKTNHFVGKSTTEFDYYREYPTDWSEIRIALDPGHFSAEEEKILERRKVKVKGQSVGSKKDIEFEEGDLTYLTCVMIQKKLIEKGVDPYNVFFTRLNQVSSMGYNYKTFLENFASSSINRSYQIKEINSAKRDTLLSRLKLALQDPTVHKNNKELFEYYRNKDFQERIVKTNENYPHITLSVHYNASDSGRPDFNGYINPVDDNYTMAFVPGAFEANELETTADKIDFIRLLLSPDLDNSQRIANYLLEEIKKSTGVEQITSDMLPEKLKAHTVATQFPGVYSRNLRICRIRGAFINGETLLQDNRNEIINLSAKGIDVEDPYSKQMVNIPPRIIQIADAYVNGIERYLQANRALKEKYSSATIKGEE